MAIVPQKIISDGVSADGFINPPQDRSIANVTDGILPYTSCNSSTWKTDHYINGAVSMSPVTNYTWATIASCCQDTIEIFQGEYDLCIALCETQHHTLEMVNRCMLRKRAPGAPIWAIGCASDWETGDECGKEYIAPTSTSSRSAPTPTAPTPTYTGAARRMKTSIGLSMLLLSAFAF